MRHSLAIRGDGACTSFPQENVGAQGLAPGGGRRLLRVAARRCASASASLTGRHVKRSVAACAMLLGASVLLSPTSSFALSVVGQFAFSQRSPGNAQPLGFVKGTTLGVGAFVIPTAGVPVIESTATNLSTGVQVNLIAAIIGVFPGLYQNDPVPFDPAMHLGVWEIRTRDSAGAVVVVTTAPIDHAEAIGYVKRLSATGDPLAPSIDWDAPKEEDIPTSCTMGYRVR